MNTTTKRLMAGAAGAAAMLALATPTFAATNGDGTVSGSGTGVLAAHGRGAVELTGDIDASRFSGRGVLVVIDHAGDAKVIIAGRGRAKLVGDTRTYAGFNGHASITGSDVTVRLVGEHLTLGVKGDGSFTLEGVGLYDTQPTTPGGEGSWSLTGTTGDL